MDEVFEWYNRSDVQNLLLEVAKDREVVPVFKDGSFGKRPDILEYPSDLIQAVKKGAIAFHGSVERWKNPMLLKPGMERSEIDELRKGWDIIIDPDVPDLEISKIATKIILSCLKDFGVRSYSIKFSGGKGFHIGIPFSSIPEEINMKKSSSQYPEILEKILKFIEWYCEDNLREELQNFANAFEIAHRIGKSVNEIVTQKGIEPFRVVKIDIFGIRHLFRLPYSLHEKTSLVSLPIKEKDLENFEKSFALPSNVKVKEKFLKESNRYDAESLIIEALDWAEKYLVEKPILEKEIKVTKTKIRKFSEDYFPPCIKKILKGLSDGRKRAVFILATFLKNMGWSNEEIEKKILEWNEKNIPPLRPSFIRNQLKWHFRQQRNLLPPNCDHPTFYKDMKIDEECQNFHSFIKNPINYPFWKIAKKKK